MSNNVGSHSEEVEYYRCEFFYVTACASTMWHLGYKKILK